VVIGSNGGHTKPPKWFLNLEANPNAKFYARWRGHTVKARIAQGEERARIWANARKQFPDYDDYAKTAAPREIPVVVLEPQ
jgi:proline iminopeptidase